MSKVVLLLVFILPSFIQPTGPGKNILFFLSEKKIGLNVDVERKLFLTFAIVCSLIRCLGSKGAERERTTKKKVVLRCGDVDGANARK